jgi:hypothetical protein
VDQGEGAGVAHLCGEQKIVRENGLVTVCEEGCPNIGECWSKKHATFMIMGDTCTRACAFCNVKTGLPEALEVDEPERVADAISRMGLAHAVITSVDRDDLDDGGAAHFARVIRATRAATPTTTVEVLTPDFLKKDGALEQVVEARPDVFNHNLETVPALYLKIRPGARYFHSLRLLPREGVDPDVQIQHHGGLGETREVCRSWTICARPILISSQSANTCSPRASTPQLTALSPPMNSRPTKLWPMPRVSSWLLHRPLRARRTTRATISQGCARHGPTNPDTDELPDLPPLPREFFTPTNFDVVADVGSYKISASLNVQPSQSQAGR